MNEILHTTPTFILDLSNLFLSLVDELAIRAIHVAIDTRLKM